MNRGFIASPPSISSSVICPPRIPLKVLQPCSTVQSWIFSSGSDHSIFFWDLKLTKNGLENPSRISLRCNNSTSPGSPPGPGENDSKSVLDAFFLGKALAELVNERVESVVGEFLSAIGRLQAEQQKQVQDFQEEVLERAKKAKERAARETMEAQGLLLKSSTTTISPINNGIASEITPSEANSATSADPPMKLNTSDQSAITKPDLTDDDPLLGV